MHSAYNRAHTIGRTYESLCRQTCQDFEWLVIDDGSSDHTKELVEGWIKEIRYQSAIFTKIIKECTEHIIQHIEIFIQS
ncbi:MAG: glycosyltransferase family 2 protein [Parabacteroides merdae]